jgi:hypothetical protein
MNDDIKLFYFGGSGGYFCLHLLLLTNKYHCKFRGLDQNFENIFQKQWNISDVSKWKLHEHEPDNSATFKSNALNKVYFACSVIDELTPYSGKLIVLYTDIETQWYLSRTKQAYWFIGDFDDAKMINDINLNFVHCYSQVRADNWPECNSIQEFNSLPDWIKNECFEKFKFDQSWDFDDLSQEAQLNKHRESVSIVYKGQTIHSPLVTDDNIINQADIVVKLQDLIKTNGEILFEQLGIKGNQRCADFVKLWLSKHTDKQRSYLLK